jgi:hypothetical protein
MYLKVIYSNYISIIHELEPFYISICQTFPLLQFMVDLDNRETYVALKSQKGGSAMRIIISGVKAYYNIALSLVYSANICLCEGRMILK